MKITVEKIMALKPCYSVEQVTELVSRGTALETLLSIPRGDARWLLSNLLNRINRIDWAESCAKRAKDYAAAADTAASAAADTAAASAAYAAYAAADTAAYAAADTAAYAADTAASAVYAAYAAADTAAASAAYAQRAEHKLACEQALQLIEKQD